MFHNIMYGSKSVHEIIVKVPSKESFHRIDMCMLRNDIVTNVKVIEK